LVLMMRAVGICGLVLAFCALPASAATRRPALSPVPGVGDTLLRSDGLRYVAFDTAGGTALPFDEQALVVLDTARGVRHTIPRTQCREEREGDGALRRSFWRTGALSHSRLLQECSVPGVPRQIKISNVRTGATTEALFPLELYASGFGSTWISLVSGGYREHQEVLFNPTSGSIFRGFKESATTYVDRDAARPVRPLCRPVRRPSRKVGAEEPPELAGVVGVSRNWVVLESGETLLAWRCGSARPLILSTHILQGGQFGSGIVTWVDHGSILNTESLDTRHRWRWRSRYSFLAVTHTRAALFAIENCPVECAERHQQNRIATASLAGL
jgi:hypothetical protein